MVRMELKHPTIILLAFVVLLPVLAHSQVDITQGLGAGADLSAPLEKAWKDACASTTPTTILIPEGSWNLAQVHLEGPNAAPIELQVKGTVKALEDPKLLPNKEFEWITINYVNFFTLSGGGVFDGMGKTAWTMNDCGTNQNCAKLPINLSFNFINNSIIQDVTTKDSKNFHVNCISSMNVTFQKFTVVAPGDSPNTDGIHIARSTGIKVLDSQIQTGDDCISMGDQLTDVLINNVQCGPGHGISIGSLGKNVDEKDVSGITIQNCTFSNTQNGVRIKTWPSAPGTITISDLDFVDLIMNNASNPIIIDQQYCPWSLCDLQKPSLIQISQVKINNVKGTSATQDVLIFSCSSGKPCQDVQIGDIDLTFTGDPSLGGATTRCENVKYTTTGGTQNPPLCVKSSSEKPVPK